MLLDRLPTLLLVLGVSIVSAGAIVGALSRLFRPPYPQSAQSDSAGITFAFQGGILSSASSAGHEFLARTRIDRPDLSSVTTYLSRQFPELGEKIKAMRSGRLRSREREGQTIMAAEGPGEVRLRAEHGLIMMTLVTPRAVADDSTQLDAMRDELQALRSIAEDAPQLIWKQDQDGQVIWANAAYLRLSDRLSQPDPNSDPVWPSQVILPDLKPVPGGSAPLVQRVPVMLPDLTEPQWFEVTSLSRGSGSVHFAVDANSTILAENTRQKFIQTLTKTFAHLSIGLAIFDRDRRLVLFNPALLELTSLPVGFLSAKPLVNSVLDRLRDLNMLPEPKNYTTWRDQVAALEAAAVRGTYCETWSLPTGRTYRVTGRPHPDGAIAFLFEDISDEVLLTRHYRSELETAQAVLDSLDEGIAVFSRAGTRVLSNDQYALIWGREDEGLNDFTFHEEVSRWQNRSAPSQFWDRLLDTPHLRTGFQDTIRLNDGRAMVCRFMPMPGGSTLVGFRPLLADKSRFIPAVEAVDTEFRRSRSRQLGAAGS